MDGRYTCSFTSDKQAIKYLMSRDVMSSLDFGLQQQKLSEMQCNRGQLHTYSGGTLKVFASPVQTRTKKWWPPVPVSLLFHVGCPPVFSFASSEQLWFSFRCLWQLTPYQRVSCILCHLYIYVLWGQLDIQDQSTSHQTWSEVEFFFKRLWQAIAFMLDIYMALMQANKNGASESIF